MQGRLRWLILDNPDLAVISSHTLMLQVPEIEGVEIRFVRAPSDGPAEVGLWV